MIGGVIIHIKPAKALLHSWLSRVILGPGGAQLAGQDLLCGPTCCLAPGDSIYTPRNHGARRKCSGSPSCGNQTLQPAGVKLFPLVFRRDICAGLSKGSSPCGSSILLT